MSPNAPLRSGWFVLTLTCVALQVLLGLATGAGVLLGVLDPFGLPSRAHAATLVWPSLLLVASGLAVLDRFRTPGPTERTRIPLVGAPVLLVTAALFVDPLFLGVRVVPLVLPLVCLCLFVAAGRDRTVGPVLHALLLLGVAGPVVAVAGFPLSLESDVHLHDTLFIAGATHLLALLPVPVLAASLSVRWRPWSAGLVGLLACAGAALLALPQLGAGIAGIPSRYPVIDGSPGWPPLLGGTLELLALGLLVGVAALPPRVLSPDDA